MLATLPSMVEVGGEVVSLPSPKPALAKVFPEETVRVLRVVEYVGPRSWVEETVARAVHGTREVGPGKKITAVTLTEYPEVLEKAR